MNTRRSVEEFLEQKNVAVVGVSRSGKKFGNTILKELRSKGYKVFGINPAIEEDAKDVFKNIESIPEKIDSAVIVVPPEETDKVIKDIGSAGIKHVWMQQGSQSGEAIKYCEENNINVVSNECILMFAEPAAFPHRIHRGIWRILGKLPK
ncbi:MAG: CoA-binding protein [bacterium]|nr:CoA-binding protein [bacterium]